MKKKYYIVLLIIAILSLSGCMTKGEKKRAQRYEMEYVYFDKHLELKDKPYTETINFKAINSTDRFELALYYLGFNRYFAQNDQEKTSNIHKSLIGLSLEMYEKESRKLIYSYKITESEPPYFDTATPSLTLGSPDEIKKGQSYKIILHIPAKKDVQSQYLRPTFIAGVLRKSPF